MPQERSIWDGIYEAVSDIREKVAEEPWWGRVVTERGELPQGLEQKEPEPQPQGLNGEVLGPETEPMHAPDNAGHLEHGFVLEGESVKEDSPHWSGVRQALTHNDEQNRDVEPELGLDR